MHADIAVDDMTHETYWRRLLRWLVDGVPDQVTIDLPTDRVQPEETAEILASVGDANFEELNNSLVMTSVTHPDGNFTDLPMEWTAQRDGEYRTSFTAGAEGFYEVRVEAMAGDELLGEDVAYVQVAPSDAEFYDSTMRAPLLERIAEDTGGRYYTPETVSTLADDIAYVGGGVTVVEEHDLWDMPAAAAAARRAGAGRVGLPPLPGAGVMRATTCTAAIVAALLVVLSVAPAGAQQTHLLVVVGLGGDQMYTEQFHGWATSLIDAAMENYGVPADNITYLGEKVDIDPERIADRSTRENVSATVEAIADRAGPTDHVAIVLFGHGTFTDGPKLNLPGRDPSGGGLRADAGPARPPPHHVRQHGERERAVRRGAFGRGPRCDDSDAQRPRAERHRLRRLLRRGVRRRRGRSGSGS